MNDPALRLQAVRRVFDQAGRQLDVLKGVDLTVERGEVVALLGQSGAGKSTLLHIAGLLEPATSGQVAIGGRDCAGLGDAERTAIRRSELGFVYQFHHLLPEFSALENVALPQLINGRSRREASTRATELLSRLGLKDRLSHRPARLSGGEQQRVAIARAIANGPKLLLADEPTGNLDGATADIVFAELVQLARGERVGALIATHNTELAARMDRVVVMRDGLLVAG